MKVYEITCNYYHSRQYDKYWLECDELGISIYGNKLNKSLIEIGRYIYEHLQNEIVGDGRPEAFELKTRIIFNG